MLHAASRGHEVVELPKPELFQLLIEHGADPRHVDNDGMTPLDRVQSYFARQTNRTADMEAIRLLLTPPDEPRPAVPPA